MIFNLVYLIFLLISAPYFIISIIRRDKHRIGLLQKFSFVLPTVKTENNIWIHAVSVGEVLLCRPLVAKLKKTNPDFNIVISVTTATGYRMAQKHFTEHNLIFYPFDFTWSVKRILKKINPKIILLAELELWPNFIMTAKKMNIPVAIINGRLTHRSCLGFKRAIKILKPMFDGVDYFWMQTNLYADRLRLLGIDDAKIKKLGSMKYDNLDYTPKNDKIKNITSALNNYPKRIILVAGSTHSPEETYLLNALKPLIKQKKLTLIIAPRHPERYNEVESMIINQKINCIRKTQLDKNQKYIENSIILLDTIGELSQVYGLSDSVYIGGTLIDHGGQNLMEPAALGKAIICGPSIYNFQETYNLLQRAGAIINVKDEQELILECQQNLLNRDLQSIGKLGVEVMRAQAGSTQKHCDAILKILQNA